MVERGDRLGDDPAGGRATFARGRRQDHAAGLRMHQDEARGTGRDMTSPAGTRTDGYTDIGGHQTWFSDSGGSGEPILILHGGISDSDMILGPLEPALGARYRILAFDRRGHGRTADTDAAFHYDDMATQTIAAIEKLI